MEPLELVGLLRPTISQAAKRIVAESFERWNAGQRPALTCIRDLLYTRQDRTVDDTEEADVLLLRLLGTGIATAMASPDLDRPIEAMIREQRLRTRVRNIYRFQQGEQRHS